MSQHKKAQHKKAQHKNSRHEDSRHIGRIGFSKRPAAGLCLLASAALLCLSAAGDGAAFERRAATAAARPAPARLSGPKGRRAQFRAQHQPGTPQPG
jgi:hypothetical protein